jgi:hypothetical protein
VYTYQSNDIVAAGTTGQKRVRVSFQSTGPTIGNAKFVSCNQDSSSFGNRDCVEILSTTYSIGTLGGKAQLNFAALPTIVTQQGTFIRSFVEHGGKVYAAGKGNVGSKGYTLRLNQPAYETIFNIFGVTKPAQTAIAP